MKRTAIALVLAAAVSAAATEAHAQGFGRSIAVSGDQVLVGEPKFGQSPGTVYVYERSGGEWTEVAALQSPDGQGAFGWGLAADGDQLLVTSANVRRGGGGQVYPFTRSGDAWAPSGQLDFAEVPEGATTGLGAALNGDVALVTVGSPRGQSAWQVRVFRRGADGWAAGETLAAPEAGGRSFFGSAFAFRDGRVFIGDPAQDENGGA
ncbi:MAG: hypothetical protein HKO53_17350, partial [Gemmatimonadetes bacterium]|nr:hypothetical protein [Gemmatimonadota bacterium]